MITRITATVQCTPTGIPATLPAPRSASSWLPASLSSRSSAGMAGPRADVPLQPGARAPLRDLRRHATSPLWSCPASGSLVDHQRDGDVLAGERRDGASVKDLMEPEPPGPRV